MRVSTWSGSDRIRKRREYQVAPDPVATAPDTDTQSANIQRLSRRAGSCYVSLVSDQYSNRDHNLPMIVSKRPAVEADHEFVRTVHHRAYRDVVERQYGPWDLAEADRLFDAVWNFAAHEIVLCDGVACGYCAIEHSEAAVTVDELVVDPDFQSRGIGTVIMKGVIEDAAARALPVRLRTHIVNRAANLYRRLGFRERGRTGTHILMEREVGHQDA